MSDSSSPTSPRPRRGRILTLTLAFVATSGVGFAFVGGIVHDPKLDASLTAWYAKMESSAAARHFKEWTELVNQVNAQREHLRQFADWRGYMERIHGTWNESVPLPAFRQTKSVQIGTIALHSIGWDNLDEWRRLPATRDAADALEQMRAVLNAQRPPIELRAARWARPSPTAANCARPSRKSRASSRG
jgi:hypothetical protein